MGNSRIYAKMPKSCAVVGCHNHSMMSKKLSFFLFPREDKDPEKLDLWLAALNRANQDGTPWRPGRYVSICSEHFVTGRPNPSREHIDYVPSLFFYPTDGPPLVKGLDRRREALTLKRQKEATKALWLEEMRSQIGPTVNKRKLTLENSSTIESSEATPCRVSPSSNNSTSASSVKVVRSDNHVYVEVPSEKDPDVEVVAATAPKRPGLRKRKLESQLDLPLETSVKGSPPRGSTFQKIQNERLRMANSGLRQENQKLREELKKCKNVIAKFIEIRQKMQKLGFNIPKPVHVSQGPSHPTHPTQNVIKIEPMEEDFEQNNHTLGIGEVWSIGQEGSVIGEMRTIGMLKTEPMDSDESGLQSDGLDPSESPGLVKIEPIEDGVLLWQ